MIAIFDEDGGGDVDFQEFVSGLSAFSSKGNKEEKLRFAFKVYDIDRDGYISNGELFIVLKMMVGSNLKDQQLQQVRSRTEVKVRELDRNCFFVNLCAPSSEEIALADRHPPFLSDRRQNNHGSRPRPRWQDQFRRVHEDGRRH